MNLYLQCYSGEKRCCPWEDYHDRKANGGYQTGGREEGEGEGEKGRDQTVWVLREREKAPGSCVDTSEAGTAQFSCPAFPLFGVFQFS